MQFLAALTTFSTLPQGVLIGFPALFSITDPIGNAVIFSQMAADRSHAERLTIAMRVGLYAAMLMLAALWAGSPVLNFFGVTLPALKLGGGLVVVASGWRLLFEEEKPAEPADDATAAGARKPTAADFAFFPVTMPLVVGPGAISVSITLGAASPGLDVPYLIGVSLAALLVAASTAILFRYADIIGRVLGPAGSRIVKRLVALLLLAIGVQIMALGLQAMLVPFLHGALAGQVAGAPG